MYICMLLTSYTGNGDIVTVITVVRPKWIMETVTQAALISSTGSII